MTIDTSSIAGEQGFIDIQFNPGNAPVLPATATVSNFTTDATLLGSLNGTPAGFDGDGDPIGMLPGDLTIDNSSDSSTDVPVYALNDNYQPVTFGTTISFDVAFSGEAVTSPNSADNGSSFGVTLYASDFATPLLTTDPNGTVETINLNADGSTTVENFFQPAGASVPSRLPGSC